MWLYRHFCFAVSGVAYQASVLTLTLSPYSRKVASKRVECRDTLSTYSLHVVRFWGNFFRILNTRIGLNPKTRNYNETIGGVSTSGLQSWVWGVYGHKLRETSVTPDGSGEAASLPKHPSVVMAVFDASLNYKHLLDLYSLSRTASVPRQCSHAVLCQCLSFGNSNHVLCRDDL